MPEDNAESNGDLKVREQDLPIFQSASATQEKGQPARRLQEIQHEY